MISDDVSFLVVEDNDLDVEKIRRSFARLNMKNTIVRGENGYEALAILRGEDGAPNIRPPYIILLDLNMPRMNGLEFLRELRQDAKICNAPVFVLTTSDRREDIEAAYEFNICGYIVKPVKLEQMFEALGTLNNFWTVCEMPAGPQQTT